MYLSMASNQIKPSLAPIGDIAGTAGYAVSAASPEDVTAAAVKKYLSDPLVLSKLTDRVYELLLEDLRCQQERVGNYGKGRWL